MKEVAVDIRIRPPRDSGTRDLSARGDRGVDATGDGL
ncbi:hypothetical protein QF035_010592 [Streptomyces umbrinus]|uniref:Uncharacterized protein n=1 Tax=Streptomyces umbrinus TaxID=67370 RepID=A0ABU0TB30_9ACTN|nr:hypothetical protein [Streptomyces umbrinus]